MSTPDSEQPTSIIPGYYAWTDPLKGIYYGPGSVSSSLPKLLDTLQITRALVVTGRSLHEKVKLTSSILRTVKMLKIIYGPVLFGPLRPFLSNTMHMALPSLRLGNMHLSLVLGMDSKPSKIIIVMVSYRSEGDRL